MYDVIVVGAGLSGLSAARHLIKRNEKLKILILEGKDRVGGRTLTLNMPAAVGTDSWDMGGQWVGSTQTHVMELIRELGLEVYPQYTKGRKLYHMGGPKGKIKSYSSSLPSTSPLVLLDLTLYLWKIDRLWKTVCVENPMLTPDAVRLDSMTLASHVEQNAWTSELKELMGVCSRVAFGVEPCQMSLLYFLLLAASAGGVEALLEATPGAAQEARIKGGAQQLSKRLAELIGMDRVKLNCPVTAILQDDTSVEVVTPSESFTSKLVIVTCPPNMAARLQFEPPLPLERQKLCQNMPMGHLNKFIITYPSAFWREKGLSGELVVRPSNDCPLCVTFDATSPSGKAALVGFIAGMQSYHWISRTFEERREAVVSSLVKYFGPEASCYIHYEEKDWAQEPYSGGCPATVMVPGMLTYFHPGLRTPFGRIHWAGTETATVWIGYMCGAVQSGQRVALEVLGRLSPHVLTEEERKAATKTPLPQHGQMNRWSHVTGSSPIRVALTTIVTVGTLLLLAVPKVRQDVIGQMLTFLPNRRA